VRIAVSGAHGTGKSTLVAALGHLLPTYASVDEPYDLLVEEGHAFAAMPGLEDFEMQLERALESIAGRATDCLFDRCPLDILAYLIVQDAHFDVSAWLPRVREAMHRMDLVVVVPIEDPDRLVDGDPEMEALRRRVDEEIRAIVLADRWSVGMSAIEVTGSPSARARQVVAYLATESLALAFKCEPQGRQPASRSIASKRAVTRST
jgi:hypothetical protein